MFLSNKQRTPISLRIGRTYGAADPAGLRHPELGAAGVERREEQPFGVRWRLDLMEKEIGGAALRQRLSCETCTWGGAPPHLYIVGRGRHHLAQGGSPQGGALGFGGAPLMGLFGPSGSLPTWAFQVRGGPLILNLFY